MLLLTRFTFKEGPRLGTLPWTGHLFLSRIYGSTLSLNIPIRLSNSLKVKPYDSKSEPRAAFVF